jgi:hypothetical protein
LLLLLSLLLENATWKGGSTRRRGNFEGRGGADKCRGRFDVVQVKIMNDLGPHMECRKANETRWKASWVGIGHQPLLCCSMYLPTCWGSWELGPVPQSGRRTWAASGAPGPATAWLACVMCRGSWPFPQFLRFWARHEPPHIRTCGRLSAHRCRNGEPGRNAAWVLGFLRSTMVATLASPTLASPTLGVTFLCMEILQVLYIYASKKKEEIH